ncbi:MAG: RNB domain-containing ribonuclease [Deltaproteobacteria bacterium]|nr:RNB domain-containing ribonuclease [Deltaproteobacteria bacterium]
MYEGRIIEYIDQGNFICALCLQDKGNRLHLLTPTNREVNLPPKRAMLVSSEILGVDHSREGLLGKLKQAEEARIRLKEKIDVPALWELLKEETGSFEGRYLAELCFGEAVGDQHVSALVRALFEDKLYFKMKDGRFFPNSEERIEQMLKQREEEAAREELLGRGGKWLQDVLDGKDVQEPACRDEVVRLLVELAVFGKESPDFKQGKELLKRAGVTDTGEARKILCKIGVWEEDENLDFIRYDIRRSFGPEVLRASRLLAETDPGAAEGGEDLRDLSVFTIDGPMTEDFDDALSVEIHDGEITLGIHITDVAGAVPEGGVLDKEAFHRASSLYLPRTQIPMLPPELSQGILSLTKGSDRAALSLLCRFDGEGNLLDYRFIRSIIRVNKRLDYDKVDATFLEDKDLSALHRLTQILQHRRIEQGALVLSLPEISIRVDPGGEIVLQTLDQNTPARTMVAECMILYNWLVARYCRDHGIPILYRTQEEPGERLPVNEDNYVFYVFKQRRKLSPLKVETEAKSHAGLGLDAYTNASSPIRRYADLVVQRQLRNVLLGKKPVYSAEDLEKIQMLLSVALRDLGTVKRNRSRYWLLKFLLQHTGETFPALVLDEMRNRYRVVLLDFLLVAEMKRQEGQMLQEGQHITVRIQKSDPWNDVLKIEYAGP